ncbi:winged helix-turn-helix domain-containing protein [Streptomyces jeddahensis]|uniref:Putative transcriptional regulator PhnF n=1 Tax=Streptomyces jeddahensis TaxID=1716141 RepID=A0A177HRC9_9ACTN|nr:winged helix-turn-helix domain-containing protein [Streptomyces jeddahensis]OAH13286.1 putative transcriptional regulator PhnF [Streptomyces jeddahensis]
MGGTGRSSADGGGREFLRVSEQLRARLADGTYRVGGMLPAQRELAAEFRVSRDTVQRVLRELVSEGWIESRQGSGSRVLKTQRIHSSTAKDTRKGGVTLGPLIGEAFEHPEVSLDVYTLTSESLDAHIRVQAERIRAGEIGPERIALRMLLPSETQVMPYPRAIGRKDADRVDEILASRLRDITTRHTHSLRTVLRALQAEGAVPAVDIEVRRVALTPTFKLYLFNGAEALHGPYEVVRRPILLDDGTTVDALDVLGLGATLMHHVRDEDADSQGSVFVDSMQTWFDSVWDRLAQ